MIFKTPGVVFLAEIGGGTDDYRDDRESEGTGDVRERDLIGF